jgi:ABC-type Zn uptake system ZnuABC Zn-binding protein ZnuA
MVPISRQATRMCLLSSLTAILALWIAGPVEGFAPGQVPTGRIRVTASIPSLGELAQEIGGDLVDVRVLLPPGASPHGFEPGPETVRAVSRSEVHLVVGRLLDGWAETLARGANPKARIERLGYGLPGPEPPAAADDSEGDPHVWLDPRKAAVICMRIGEILASLRPGQADIFRSRAADLRGRLEELDRNAEKRLAPFRDVPFVAYHGGLNHLVARYGLRQIAVLEPFPGREPSPKELKGILDEIRKSGARVIFSEPQFSARLSEVLGKESGVPVTEIDLVGGTRVDETYEELFSGVVDALVAALGSKEGKP